MILFMGDVVPVEVEEFSPVQTDPFSAMIEDCSHLVLEFKVAFYLHIGAVLRNRRQLGLFLEFQLQREI